MKIKKFYFLLFIFFVIISCDDKDDPCFATKVDILGVNKIMNCNDFKFNLKNADYMEIKVINNL